MANDGERLLVAPSGQSQSLFAADNDELKELATLESWPPDHVACTNGADRLASRESQRTTLVARFSAFDGLWTNPELKRQRTSEWKLLC